MNETTRIERRRRSAGRVAVAAAVLAVLMVPSESPAQSTSAALEGEVRTEDGRPLADAVVQARSPETGAVRTGLSDASGSYRIDLLTPGTWTVAARLPDGSVSQSRSVELGLQQKIRLDFTVGTGLSERLTVTAQSPLVDPKETSGLIRVTSQQADVLPLQGRVFTDLAMLDSSVRTAAPGNFAGERGTVFVVNGQTGRSNTFLVDGLDNNDRTSGTALNSFFSQQVIQEFVLSTYQYAPEFGRASGGVLNIVTRQGGNEHDWGVFAQGTTERLNESGTFVDRLPDSGIEQDTVRRFAGGVNFSGPFRRDRAFYFAAYEHQEADQVIPYTGVDRSGIVGGRMIAPAEDDNLFVRTDFNLGPNKSLMFRLSADDRTDLGVNVGGVATPDSGFRIEEQDVQLAASFTAVLGGSLVSETRFLAGISSFEQSANSDLTGVERPSGVFGGNVLNLQDRDEDKIQLVQNLTVQRGEHTLKFGVDVTRSRTEIRTAFNPNGSLFYNSDRAFEAGDCGLGVGATDLTPTPQNPNPVLEDGTVVDALGNPLCRGVLGVDDDGDGLVDEGPNIFSYPVFFTYIDGQPSARLDDTTIGVFAQDSWKFGPRLQLDFGLRYDLSTYELPDDTVIESSIPNGGADRDNDNVAPRFGFTFMPRAGGKLVLRGGGGIFYDKLVLGFPAVAAITSGTAIGLLPTQGFALEITEDAVEEYGIDEILDFVFFPDSLVMRFSTDTELETPYTVQFNLGFERRVGRNGAVKANVVRSRGYHRPLMRDLNPVVGVLPTGDPTLGLGVPVHRDDSTGSIAAITTVGRSWYWGANAGWRWQSQAGWLSASYTLSRSEDTGFDPLKGGIALPPDSDNLGAERGRSDGDRRHRLVLSGETALPWWGLRVSAVLDLASGLPFNVTTGKDDNLDGILTDRPAGVGRNSGEETPLEIINRLREEHNATLLPEDRLAPVDSLDEPSFAQLDLRFSRPFQVGQDEGQGEFYLQFFNVFDRENAGVIEGRAISTNFGRPITLAGPPRTIEAGLKLGF